MLYSPTSTATNARQTMMYHVAKQNKQSKKPDAASG
jgi:hypothetical protein